MDNENNQLTDLSIVVSKNFEVSESDSLIPAGDFKTLEEFKIYLANRLAFLLDNKYDNKKSMLWQQQLIRRYCRTFF